MSTQETYLGYERIAQFALPVGAAFDERRAYELPARLGLNQWALAGEWTIGTECVVLDRARERTVEITFREPGAYAYVFTFG